MKIPSFDELQDAAPRHIIVEKIAPDPFGRGWQAVFYRDTSINVLEVFYLALYNWHYTKEKT